MRVTGSNWKLLRQGRKASSPQTVSEREEGEGMRKRGKRRREGEEESRKEEGQKTEAGGQGRQESGGQLRSKAMAVLLLDTRIFFPNMDASP